MRADVGADVLVAGAGPAGCAAAITLARAGRDVLVVDRARFPRDKCCGDGLTAGALRRLEQLGLSPRDVASFTTARHLNISSPSGRVARLPLSFGPGHHAAVARRADLDAALVGLARRCGARVLEGRRVTGHAEVHDDGITVEVEGLGMAGARYAIGADGAWSPLRRALASGPSSPQALPTWQAVRQYVSGARQESSDLWVWLEADLLPGYAWSFPAGPGLANVGFGVHRSQGLHGADVARIASGLLERPHVREVLGSGARGVSGRKAWPIPSFVAPGKIVEAGGRALFAGDAAQAADPMTGEGIGQAIETGVLAARAVLAAGPHAPLRAASGYAGSLRGGLALDNRLASLLSLVLASRLGARGAVRGAIWGGRQFARWLFEDYPRAALATPWRWDRSLLGSPGAWSGER